ncbi:GTP cyclohydrolase II RibA [Undibacterium sp. TS12]|uniref:GTP cyclohydrolase II RibA n=1 Tax=Undibacterium sp. TS12 TaxID=2908202 RepID=UPI001F4D2A59|nr:GTP cyclohydrolase II RibA [Undibacterium sp. TS12]MCH8622526.1 GTP cyclohydrolase II RibA [Undibacterium sp. TS12]
MNLEASTQLPTDFGQFLVRVYRNKQGQEVTAICSGALAGCSNVPVRVHSACFTAEALGSLKCDCKQQLDFALSYIGKHHGVVLYLPQEGRGIGLSNKIRAYALQEKGYDTIEANRMLNLPVDSRTYEDARDILSDLQVNSICLLTNNPAKLQNLEDLGVQVAGRIPVPSAPNGFSAAYLDTKQQQMGHLIKVNNVHNVKPEQSTARQKTVQTPRPFIHVNFAIDSEASTVNTTGAGASLSCEADWRRVHELREKYTAIAVGANTWRLDTPRLTVRADVLGRKPLRQPARVIFSGHQECQFKLDLSERQSILIGQCEHTPATTQTFIYCPDHELASPLSELKELRIDSMLVEGGLTLIDSFIRQQMVDLLTIYVRTPCIATATNAAIKAIPELDADLIEARKYGQGTLLSVAFTESVHHELHYGMVS